ncbi:MAG: alpha/beta fold hydrolase [Euzebya sp.]
MRAVIIGVIVALTGCVATQGEDPGPLVATPATEIQQPPVIEGSPFAGPEMATASCPGALLDQAECGFLIVPENRADPVTQVVEVAWARIPAAGGGSTRARPPLLVLPDGPGQGAMAEAEGWLDSPLRQDRDVILLDPRGAGRSFPSLDCGQPPRPGALPLDLVEDCRGQLTAEGIDLRAYDTSEIAADIADLRQALVLDRIDLLGIGHGARVALELLREGSGGIHAVVLDSPIPPQIDVYDERPLNAQSALNRLFDECAQTPVCASRFPDLPTAVEEMVQRLNADAAGEAGAGVTGDALVIAAVAAMRGAAGPAVIPWALDLAVQGQVDEGLEQLQQAAIAGSAVPTSLFSEGLRLSSDCRDEVPDSFATGEREQAGLDQIGQAIAQDVATFLRACEIWMAGQADRSDSVPVQSSIRALVLTGEFDPLSPPAWGASAAALFDQARVVQIDGAGHRVHDIDDCTLDLVAAFLDRPRAPVVDGCAVQREIDFRLR